MTRATSLIIMSALVITHTGCGMNQAPETEKAFTDRSHAYEYFSNPWGLIGLKDYPSGTRIAPHLALLLGDRHQLRICAGERMARIPPSIRRTLSMGYLPIVQLRFSDRSSVGYQIELLAAPEKMGPAGGSFWGPTGSGDFDNYLHMAICGTGRIEQPATIAFEFVSDLRLQAAGPARIVSRNLSFRKLALDRYTVDCGPTPVMDLQTTGEVFAKDRKLHVGFRLAGGEIGHVYGRVPNRVDVNVIPTPPHRFSDDLSDSYTTARRKTSEEWNRFLGAHPAIGVPEKKVMDCYRTGIVQQFIARDREVLKPGEGFYEDIYLRDAAYQVYALDVMGYGREAEASLEKCLDYQRPDGRFESQKGQLDANGYMLWILAEHFRLTGDSEWLTRVFPRMKRSVAWLLSAISHSTGAFPGILPNAPADGENLWDGDCHIVGYDLWNLRGLEHAAFAARTLRKDDLEVRWGAAAETYRQAIRRNVLSRGLDFLPPSYEGRGTHWGNLEALFPSPVFSPDDFLVENTLRRVESTYREGVMPWSPDTVRAIHPYATSFAHMSRLHQGYYNKAMDGFYAQLLHTSAANGFAEGIYDDTREAWRGTIPHQWGSALFMVYLRRLLIQEGPHTLSLCPAVPDHWFSDGNIIQWDNLPTHFGPTSLRIEANSEFEVHGGILRVQSRLPEGDALRASFLFLPPGMRFEIPSKPPDGVAAVNETHVQLKRGRQAFTLALQSHGAPRVRSFLGRAAEPDARRPSF